MLRFLGYYLIYNVTISGHYSRYITLSRLLFKVYHGAFVFIQCIMSRFLVIIQGISQCPGYYSRQNVTLLWALFNVYRPSALFINQVTM